MTNPRNDIKHYSLTPALTLLILLTMPAFSEDQQIENNVSTSSKKVVSIDTYTDSRDASADQLGFAASYADRNGNNIDQALSLCRKSLQKNNDDIDVHLNYARLLEEKFTEQNQGDATLYLDCVKEWLIVLRNEAGDERGMTVHGIGLPFTGLLFKDDDRYMLARSHLVSLTGIEPKGWETDAKYLQRVSKLSTVKGKLLAKESQQKEIQ